ncbi:replication initiation factor domain-containing protein [Listeria rustica]|uniref:Replication initiation factor n=1 Tax=Listeria rustica TaxID=2713503 RepID=A0A7W1T4U9_9LIST|nr:replication initiation factor domain-containing protein [Listeria rustica]MBA3925528.1 replication initiation factor [Listeria rustica]
MSEANQPTDTKRWVDSQKKKDGKQAYLSACIDWMQLTLKDITAERICEELLGFPFDLMVEDARPGIKGGASFLCFDDIRIFRTEDKNRTRVLYYQLMMTGEGCRQFEKFLELQNRTWFDFVTTAINTEAHFTRIDLAIDDRKTYFKIGRLIDMSKKGLCQTRLRTAKRHDSFELSDGTTRGDTIDFGSRQSEFFMTFYEKNYEQASKFGMEKLEELGKWNRYELKFRQDMASQVAYKLVAIRDVMDVALPILNHKLRFIEAKTNEKKANCPTWKPWEYFMSDVSKIKLKMEPVEKNFPRFYGWMATSVGPSLWIAEQIKRYTGKDIVREVIDTAVINKKHRFDLQCYLQTCSLLEGKPSSIENKPRERAILVHDNLYQSLEHARALFREPDALKENKMDVNELLQSALVALFEKNNVPHLSLLKNG